MGKLLVSNTYILKANFQWLSYCGLQLGKQFVRWLIHGTDALHTLLKRNKNIAVKRDDSKNFSDQQSKALANQDGHCSSSDISPAAHPWCLWEKEPRTEVYWSFTSKTRKKEDRESISKQWESIVTLARIQIHALKWEMVMGSYSTEALNS